jgi:hypothetical protein
MVDDSRRRMRRWSERPFYSDVLLTLLFATVAGSVALIVNWNGTPEPAVMWICGLSAAFLLLLTIARWLRS